MTSDPIRPSRLGPGGRIRLVAPAARVDAKRVRLGQASLEALGFQVSLAPHLYAGTAYLAGSDQERADDLEAALTDPDVDGVFLARGGWGTLRALEYVHRQRVAEARPKVVLGYSDITALHAYLNQLGWVTFHGPVAEMDWREPNGRDALRLVGGASGRLGDGPMEQLYAGECDPREPTAPLCGGNLAVLTALVGTPFFPPVEGAVLYLEEVGEAPYRIDRMLTQMRLAGVLAKVRAVIFGEATRCTANPDPEGYTAKDVVLHHCREAHRTLWWGIAAGHGPRKVTLPLGWPVTIRDGWLCVDVEAVR